MKFAFKSQEGRKEVLKYYDMLLTKGTVSYETFMIDTNYGETFVIAKGEKDLPPLILLHGSGINSAMWVKEMDEYAKKHRVYAVDIVGEPGKSDERQLPFVGDDFSNWLNEVFNGLSINKASIVGISLGAWIGIKFAIKYSNRVEKLVLLCPAGIGEQRKSFVFKAFFYTILGDKGIDKLYCKLNGDNPMPEIILNYQKLIGKHFNFRKEFVPLFTDDDLLKLTMPIALFVGDKDIMFYSQKTANRLRILVNNAQINVIKDEGHSLVNQGNEIREFLK